MERTEEDQNMFLERWIRAERTIDRLQEEIDILRERERLSAHLPSHELTEARRNIIELRHAIALHRRTIDSPASPALAGMVDKYLWAVLDRVPSPIEENLIDE